MRKFDTDKSIAVVLGLGQNGLATVRCLGRKGVPVIGIDGNIKQYTARSKYCERKRCGDFKKGDGLIRLLIDIGKDLPGKAVLFPSGDSSLYLLSERRDDLRDYYLFTFPRREVVSLSLDKKRFYEFAAGKGFPMAMTFFPKGEEDCRLISKEIPYPCIIKPFQPNLGWRQKFPDQKLFKVSGPEQLLRTYERLSAVHSDLVVQECIEGDESNLMFSLTYLNRDSEPLGMFTGRKLRQYPPHFGTSSMAQSIYNKEIADKSAAILKEMKYTGYGSVEFKLNQRRREFQVIEVSARTWFPHGISAACGMNLEYFAYCDVAGLPLPPINGFREGVKWIHEERDLKSSLQYLRNGELTLRQWIKSYGGARTYAISAWDDPGPMIRMMSHISTVPLRYVLRRLNKLIGKKGKNTGQQEIALGN
jgi:D-aspartate ligase